MFKLIELGLKNFQSYGNNMTVVNLDFKKSKLMVGKNNDSAVDGQIDGNGAGKSAILNALCYALYDKTISGVSKTDIINNINNENLEVYIIFQNKHTYYKVERFRKNKAKGGDGTKLFAREGDTNFTEADDITPAGANNINAEIQKILEIPFEIFIRIVVFDANYEPFLNMELPEQREVIEELFGFTELSLKAELLKEQIKNDKKDLELNMELNEQQKKAVLRFEQQLAGLQEKQAGWTSTNTQEAARLKTEIASLSKVKFSDQELIFEELNILSADQRILETSIKDLEASIKQDTLSINRAKEWEASNIKAIKQVESDISNIPEIDIELEKENIFILEEATKELKDSQTEKATIDAKISSLLKEQQKYNKDSTSLKENKCPFCSQQFKDAAEQLLHTTTRLSEIAEELEFLEQKKQKSEKNITKFTKVKQTVEASSNFKTLKEIFDFESTKTKLIDKQTTLKANKNPHITGIYDMFIDDLEFSISTNTKTLTDNKTSLGEIETSITELVNRLKYKSEVDLAVAKQQLKSLKDTLVKTENEINPFDSIIEETLKNKNDLGEDRTEMVNQLDDGLFHKDFLLKLLTKKDSFIRKALLNKGLPLLNSKLKYYLNKTGLPHKVEFQQDMSVKITQFKTQIGYTSLSSGQKARVNLALMFSFRDVLQARHGMINLCILDECLDRGLSNVGVQMSAKMIKQVATDNKLSMIVISHRDEIASMFDDKIEIELTKGFSRIVSGN